MHSNPEYHHRRSIRLPNFDYSRPGAYFITFCIHDRTNHLFSEGINGKMVINEFWGIADKRISSIPCRFVNTTIELSVVIHRSVDTVVPAVNPVGAIPVWQRNYFEHIIRNAKSRFVINKYIRENPAKWHKDSENHLDFELRDFFR